MDDKRPRGRPKTEKGPKKLVSIKLDAAFHERLQNAAYWLRTSVNAIIEEGAGTLLDRLEKKHNEGQPFDPRESKA